MRALMMVTILSAAVPLPVAAQSHPPVQGTIALEGTMKKFYRGLNALVVTTVDGAEHVYHFTKGLVVHGGKGGGPEAVDALPAGTEVVVHYRINGGEESVEEIDRVAGEGLKIVEGVVVQLDRRRKRITLKMSDGTTETLRLTDRAAGEADESIEAPGGVNVAVYYSDESGHKVVHYLKTTP